MLVAELEEVEDRVDVYEGDEVLLTEPFQALQVVLVGRDEELNHLVRGLQGNGVQLVRVDVFQKKLEGLHRDILDSDDGVLLLFHAVGEHVGEDLAAGGDDALVGLDLVAPLHSERHVRVQSRLQQTLQVERKLLLRHLDSYLQSPEVLETVLAVVASVHVEQPLHQGQRVPAPRNRIQMLQTLRLMLVAWDVDFFPPVGLDIERVHIIQPLQPIIPSKVINLVVD
mmetsp:Transcript_8596/g.7933  ORF Transcript_8596/g.7933 Transcript_8596/m.7933 type:complete len:226 (-) Transcript_8596:948-1625(-)